MTIFKGSRFSGSYIFQDSSDAEKVYLDTIQEVKFKPKKEDLLIQFQEGMRVDILAKQLYGSEVYDWVIMQANPEYETPFDIKVGDIIIAPLPERVISVVNDSA